MLPEICLFLFHINARNVCHLFAPMFYTMTQCLPWKHVFSLEIRIRYILSNLVNVLTIQNRKDVQNLEGLTNFSSWGRFSYIYNLWKFFNQIHRDWRMLLPCNSILQGIAPWGRKVAFLASQNECISYMGREVSMKDHQLLSLYCVLISMSSPMECTNTCSRNTKSDKYIYKMKKYWSYLSSLQSWKDWETSQSFIGPGQKLAWSDLGGAKKGEIMTKLSQEEISAGLLSWIKHKGAQFSIPSE